MYNLTGGIIILFIAAYGALSLYWDIQKLRKCSEKKENTYCWPAEFFEKQEERKQASNQVKDHIEDTIYGMRFVKVDFKNWRLYHLTLPQYEHLHKHGSVLVSKIQMACPTELINSKSVVNMRLLDFATPGDVIVHRWNAHLFNLTSREMEDMMINGFVEVSPLSHKDLWKC